MRPCYLQLFSLLCLIGTTLAVKDYLFKNCEQSGFCHRNRAFANNIKTAIDFIPYYSIDSSSINIDSESDGLIIKGNILKTLPNLNDRKVILPFEISSLSKNNVRFKIDEERQILSSKFVNSIRYNETSIHAFDSKELPLESKSNVQVEINKDFLTINYGKNKEYRAELFYFPVKISILYNNEVQLVVNEQNFLNLEHFRLKSENELHLSEEEIDYDMFKDSFPDSKDDKMPLGPESIGLDFNFRGFRNVFGIPEHADTLNLKETIHSDQPYRLFNVDIFEYEVDSRLPMYGSIPLLLGSKPGVSVGLFWVNAADTFIDIDKTSSQGDVRSHWVSENGIIDVMIFIGKTPEEINDSYGLITGYPKIPQLFALGYHQCRWNYNDERDVLEINSLMDEHQIPYDTIWLDIEYADSKKYFTWQKEKFPNVERMLKELDHTSRNLVIIVDPHFKTGYFISEESIEQKITIRNSENDTYYGHCWPGESVWIDTLNPNSQTYWDSKFSMSETNDFLGKFSTNIHLWNDMNEPSVFNGPETSCPRDNMHYGDWEHRSIHNLFGLTYHEATYNSLVKRNKHTERQRPFILTRSYFAGSQRTAAMWTGDNMSKWEYLQVSIPMVLTSNIVNMPFAGADVGGFFGNPSKELLTRWYQTGIWYPFFRAHAHIDSRRREPWVPGEPFTSIIRDAIKLRYSLLPVFYSSFHQSSLDGSPIIKPVFYETPDNEESYLIEDQFFLGNSGLLIKPVTEEGASTIEIYIPDNEVYYDLSGGFISSIQYQFDEPAYIKKSVSLSDIPILLKGGSIISKKERYRRSSKLMYNDPYTLIIAPDTSNNSNGFLYIDDGESFNYLQGQFVKIQFNSTVDSISSEVFSSDQDYLDSLSDVAIEKIIILSTNDIQKVFINQNNLRWEGKIEASGKNIVIHKPSLALTLNWKIEIMKTKDKKANVHDEL